MNAMTIGYIHFRLDFGNGDWYLLRILEGEMEGILCCVLAFRICIYIGQVFSNPHKYVKTIPFPIT